jgi:hypothetical protein
VPDFEFTPGTDEALGRIDTPYCDPDDFTDEPRTKGREGLPPKFRMRHAPHYVEQLMGDAPLQTVRQIPIDHLDDVDGPTDGSTFDELIASVREVGILQPLLVASRDGSRFEIVAGSNRLFAAREAGLNTVPCLVVHADVESAKKMRAQAGRRAVPEPPAAPGPAAIDTAASALARTALAEIGTSMRFVNSLAPVARASESAARVSMILSAISIEANRAKLMAAAAAVLTRSEPVRWAAFDCAALIDAIRGQVSLEARVKGVRVEWTESFGLAGTVADTDALATGWSGLLHTVLDVAREGDRLSISLNTPRVRPAIIFEVALRSGSGVANVDRFLDPEWRDHPAGQAGTVMLAAALLSAQLHGGRVSARTVDDGMAVAFVAPQPLDLS